MGRATGRSALDVRRRAAAACALLTIIAAVFAFVIDCTTVHHDEHHGPADRPGLVAVVSDAAGLVVPDHPLPDHCLDGTVVPDRYFDTVYNDAYCHQHGLLTETPPAEPETIAHPAERVVEAWTRCTTVIDPGAPTGHGGAATGPVGV